jgi:hypothetical protein
MRIVEVIPLKNAEKAFFGRAEIKLELDTDTGEVAFDAPAMFVDPIVDFDELKQKLDRLAELRHHQ